MRKNLLNATLVSSHEISVIYLSNFYSIDDVDFFLTSNDFKRPLKKEQKSRQSITEIILHSNEEIELGKDYKVETSEEESVYLDLDEFVSHPEFDDLYSYDGDDLGSTYSKKETIFKLWSPLADRVTLKLEKGENSFTNYEMTRQDRGVYYVKVKGDLFLKKYKYVVRVNGREKEINDPYGKAVSVNSTHSVVVDLSILEKIKKEKPKSEFKSYVDAIIYELHIRDFTETANIENPGTYLGLIEKADYLQKLGITHVQLLPVLDSATVDDIVKDTYNWGYDVLSFFALEGSLSSLPEDPLSRLLEFKTLVSELHKRDIRVNLDVVYNHIYDYVHHDFQKNVPFYYFRKYKNRICNASGCGNDIATERKMVSKIIIDSVKYLIETFDVDGFRFDLMGLIDVDTMNKIYAEAKALKEDIMIYGEGWHMGTNLPEDMKASMVNADRLPGIAFFNDTFRDLVKGSTFDKLEKGYISGNLEYKNQVEKVFTGSVLNHKFSRVDQSLNYLECHDNQTLYDKLMAIHDDEEEVLKIIKFANSLLLFSLGIPFIHMGQEIGLSKFGLDNTYNVIKVNNMDWDLVEKRSDMVNYMANLIKVRKAVELPRLEDIDLIDELFDFFYLPNGVLTIAIRDERFTYGHKKVLFIINPTEKVQPVQFDEFFKLYFSPAGLIESKGLIIQNFIAAPHSLVILTED